MEHTEIRINIPDDVHEIMSVIKEYGANSYVVGGCVRDSILGREPHDWDICTPALPGELLVEFEEKGYKVIPTWDGAMQSWDRGYVRVADGVI